MAGRKQPEGGAGEAPGFETSLERLETIVRDLEGGELSLEDSLARYEEGIGLSQRLTRTLAEAETRIERLTQRGGEPAAEPFALEGERGRDDAEGELPF